MEFLVDVEFSTPEDEVNIQGFEIGNQIRLPSDYRYLLLNKNEVRLSDDKLAMILDSNGEGISGLDGAIYSLELFSFAYDPYPAIEVVNEDIAQEVSSQFYVICTLFYQGVLLIGKEGDLANKIYGFVPDFSDTPFYLSDNIFQFFNNRISIID